MNWLYSLSSLDFFLIGGFILLYGGYIFRIVWLARHLNTSAWGVIPKFFLRGIYFALLMIALMGPSFGDTERNLTATGHDIYLLIDVSRSMGRATLSRPGSNASSTTFNTWPIHSPPIGSA